MIGWLARGARHDRAHACGRGHARAGARCCTTSIEGLCIATGLPKPKVYIVDDPAPNAFAFGRSPQNARASRSRAACSTSCRAASSKACSRTRCRTSATATCRSRRSRSRPSACSSRSPRSRPARAGSPTGATTTTAAARSCSSRSPSLAGILAFGARSLSLAISRHREELADTSAAALVSPDGLRKALEKLEADHTVLHHVSRATAHLWLVTPLHVEGDDQHAKLNRMFDTHPPLAERIAILRKLEGLDPNERAARSTRPSPACPSTSRSSPSRPNGAWAAAMQGIQPADTAADQAAALAAARRQPGLGRRATRWRAGRQAAGLVPRRTTHTLRYWHGVSWTRWTATWDGKKWQQHPADVRPSDAHHVIA